jgi:hypothetical protein
LGIGSTSDSPVSTPLDVVGLSSDIAAIDAGWSHTCVLTVTGRVKCWGNNSYGLLGFDMTTGIQPSPVDMTGLSTSLSAISLGASHTCGLTSAGSVKCWGWNDRGQLGDGTIPMPYLQDTFSYVPVDVVGLSNGVVAIGTGSDSNHTCAVTSSGGVKCWGSNSNGQLGNGLKGFSTIPVDVFNLIFMDVSPTNWAREWIERLYSAGLTDGCSTSPALYCPDESVTRAQGAVLLEKSIHDPALALPFEPSAQGAPDIQENVAPTFSDILGHWAEDWINAFQGDGMTAGCATGLFCPENPITRAQMAVFLLKARHGSSYLPPEVGDDTGFDDVSVDYWASAWIKQLAEESITSGCGDGMFCPDDSVTRAQIAVFLVKTFNLP